MSEAPKISFLDVALNYASIGWPVFPIDPRGKKPIGRIVPRGCLDATANETKVRDYWQPAPSANIGIATGKPSGFFVLDVDPKNGGEESFKQLIQEMGSFRGTLTARTGSGGSHYLYKMPEGIDIRNSQGLVAPGIDVRGTGGYIVAPPSIHPNGNAYLWANDKDIVEAPAELIKLITSSKREQNKPSGDGEIIKHGYQHDTLFYMGASMRFAGMDEAAIFASLWETNTTRCEIPGPEENIRELAKSICRQYPEGGENMHTFIARVMKRELPEEKPETKEESPLTDEEKKQAQLEKIIGGGFTAEELDNMDLPEIKWAIPGVIPEGASLLAGKPKSGKSFLALNVAVAIATGGRALGKIPVKKGRVLYLQLEGTKKGLQGRLRSLMNGDPAPPLLHFYPEWQTISEGGLKRLNAWLRYYKDTALVIIDTFKKVRGNINGSKGLYDQDYNSANPFTKIAEDNDTAILLIHHTNKMSDVEDPLDAISGSTGLAAAVDTAMILKKNPQHEGVDLYITGRETEPVEYALKFDPRIKTWIHQGDAAQFAFTNTQHEILAVLKILDSDETMKPYEIANRAGLDRELVKKTCQRMYKENLLSKRGTGNYKINPLSDVPAVPAVPKHNLHNSSGDSGDNGSPKMSPAESAKLAQKQRFRPNGDSGDSGDIEQPFDSEAPF